MEQVGIAIKNTTHNIRELLEKSSPYQSWRDGQIKKHFAVIGIEDTTNALKFVHCLEQQEPHHTYSKTDDELVKACLTKEDPVQFYEEVTNYIDPNHPSRLREVVQELAAHEQTDYVLLQLAKIKHPLYKQSLAKMETSQEVALVQFVHNPTLISDTTIEAINQSQEVANKALERKAKRLKEPGFHPNETPAFGVADIETISDYSHDTASLSLLMDTYAYILEYSTSTVPQALWPEKYFHDAIKQVEAASDTYPLLPELHQLGYDVMEWVFSLYPIEKQVMDDNNDILTTIYQEPQLKEKVALLHKYGIKPLLRTNTSATDAYTYWQSYEPDVLEKLLIGMKYLGAKASNYFSFHTPNVDSIRRFANLAEIGNHLSAVDFETTVEKLSKADLYRWQCFLVEAGVLSDLNSATDFHENTSPADVASLIEQLSDYHSQDEIIAHPITERVNRLTDPETIALIQNPQFIDLVNNVFKLNPTKEGNWENGLLLVLDHFDLLTEIYHHKDEFWNKVNQLKGFDVYHRFEFMDVIHQLDKHSTEESQINIDIIKRMLGELSNIDFETVWKRSQMLQEQGVTSTEAVDALLAQATHFMRNDRNYGKNATWSKAIELLTTLTREERTDFFSRYPEGSPFWEYWSPSQDTEWQTDMTLLKNLIHHSKTFELINMICQEDWKKANKGTVRRNLFESLLYLFHQIPDEVEANIGEYIQVEFYQGQLIRFNTGFKVTSTYIHTLENYKQYYALSWLLDNQLVSCLIQEDPRLERFWKALRHNDFFYDEILAFIFAHKDKCSQYFDEAFNPTPQLLEEGTQTHEEHWEWRSLMDICIDQISQINDPEVKQNQFNAFLETMIRCRLQPDGLSMEYSADYIRLHPELEQLYNKLVAASKEPYWTADIPDNDEFWKKNLIVLAHMHAAGFLVRDFARFRSIVNNPRTAAIFTSQDVTATDLISLTKSIDLTLENIYYCSEDSIKHIRDRLNDPRRVDFYKHLLAERPFQFENTIQVLYSADMVDIEAKIMRSRDLTDKLFKTIEEFGNITPTLIKYVVLEPSHDKAIEFVRKYQEFQNRVHQNQPIMDLVTDDDSRELIAELVCITYPGMNLASANAYLQRLDDRCEDLEDLVIRSEGYHGKVQSSMKTARLHADTQFNKETIGFLAAIFSKDQSLQYLEKGGDKQMSLDGWMELLTTGGSAANLKDWFTNKKHLITGCVRVALGAKLAQFTENAGLDTSQISKVSNLLAKAQELCGIYYKDNAADEIETYLDQNPDIVEILKQKATRKRLEQIPKNFKDVGFKAQTEINAIIKDALAEVETHSGLTNETLGKLLAFMTEKRFFMGESGLRNNIKLEAQKIELVENSGRVIDPSLIITGYVTKNATSFFAKTTAGICTADDVDLFNRPEHFHLNLLKDGKIVGNIQGYGYIYNNKPALVFRGFNPSSSLVSKENAEVLCDQMVDIVKQLAADNGIDDVFIPEQTDWHNLTNRVGEGVYHYFETRFIKPGNEVVTEFEIRDGQFAHKLYRLTAPVAI